MPDKMQRFTQRARRVLSLAQEEAERMQHSYIGTEHLLLGLMKEDGGVAGRVLKELGLELEEVEQLVERNTRSGQRTPFAKINLSPGTKKVLELAVDEARRMGHDPAYPGRRSRRPRLRLGGAGRQPSRRSGGGRGPRGLASRRLPGAGWPGCRASA